MNKAKLVVKSTLCLASAIAIALSGKMVSHAATETVSTGIAGISVSLDNYYSEKMDQESEVLDQIVETASLMSTTGIPVEEQKYKDYAVSAAKPYVNIRAKESAESEAVGKLYGGSVAKVLETKGEWAKVQSGSVTGYIKLEYLITGLSDEDMIKKYANRYAEVTAKTLRVREEKSLESETVTLIPEGEKCDVKNIDGEWVEIALDSDVKGFVSLEYVAIKEEFKYAISKEEEEAILRREEEARKAEEERRKAEEERRKEEEERQQATVNKKPSTSNKKPSTSNKKPSTSNKKPSTSNKKPSTSNKKPSSTTGQSAPSNTALGTKIAQYAQKFVGNRYVYGGTSLTNGTDCSGFTMSVYRHFGISLPRTSAAQAASAGVKIKASSAQPGDLVFYASSGRVNHVALYIGGGKVVHASNPSSGIKISNMYYRTPYCVRRVVK